MAIPLKEFDATGVLVTDEIVRCDEAKVIDAVTYYLGYLNYVPNSNLVGNTSATYCVYTAAAKAGSRKTVLLDGYPGDTSTVSVDKLKGIVYAKEVDDLYFTYLAHEPVNQGGGVSIDIPYQLTNAAAITMAELTFPTFRKFAYISVDVTGGVPSANATVTLTNGTESENVTIDDTETSYVLELADLMKVTTAETLTISTADGNDAYGLALHLMDL